MAEGMKSPISRGTRGEHLWLSSTELTLDDLLEACPQIVTGKYVAITSFDSGSLVPTEEERAAGWEYRVGVAYSPRITSPGILPHDGYDEWYVFREKFDIGPRVDGKGNFFDIEFRKGQVAAFVNFGPGFLLSNPNDLTELFWQQYGLIRPHCFISDGLVLNVVTSDRDLFGQIESSLPNPK